MSERSREGKENFMNSWIYCVDFNEEFKGSELLRQSDGI